MLVELRGQGDRRDRLLCQAIVPTLIVFATTVSCSRPDMPQPRVGTLELWFPARVTDTGHPQLVQRGEGQPKARREQPTPPAPLKVATVRAPKATNVSGSRQTVKKANTPPRLDVQREEQLFQEFLEWRRRQRDLP